MLASAQNVEHARPLRCQSFELLDVPTKYASLCEFPAALLDDHFEHPETATPIVSNGSLGAVASLIHP